MPDFGLVGGAYEAASYTQDTQRLINWYPEIDMAKAQGERGVIALYPTPGLQLITQLDAVSEVRGMHVVPGGTMAYIVCGNILYSFTSGLVATRIGSLGTSSGIVSITDNGQALYIADGINRYYYMLQNAVFNGTISGTTLTVNSLTSGVLAVGMTVAGSGVTTCTITAGSGTSWTVSVSQTVGPVAMTATPNLTIDTTGAFTSSSMVDVLDNYLIYNSPNSNQWGSTNVSSVVSSGLNFASTLSAPGNVIGLIADHRQVFLLSEYTCEAWADVGSFPFAFQAIPGSTMQHGCAAKGSIARFGESFAFLAQDRRGRATVVQMRGYQSVKISTHAIENAINNYPVNSDAIAYTYQTDGHEFYVLTFPSADATWVYDGASQMWHQRGWRDSNNVLHRHRSNCCINFAGQIIVGDYQNGNLYYMTTHAYDDNGDPIKRVRRCRHLTEDLKRVFHNELQVQFQPGVGTSTGAGIDPKFTLRWSDDGGFTFGNDHIINIGKIGKYKNRARKLRLGYSRDRIYEIEMTDPVYAVIVSANLITESGDN